MAAPILSFIYNRGADTVYSGTGGQDADWYLIDVSQDKKIYTGGGILGTLPVPTAAAGTRDATVRPAFGTYVVPQIYIETPSLMYHVPTASGNPNTNRYVFGVYVNGTITSDLYLEYWDDNTFTTTDLPVLSGSVNYPYSMVNAIRTTNGAPPGGWSGGSADGAYLSGFSPKLALKDASSVANEAVYFNIYTRIPFDAELFHNEPIEAYRYLYS
jgi:hypothetical protein